MSLWRRLFPKYECKRCRDTHVVYGDGWIGRCDCSASKARIQQMYIDFIEGLPPRVREYFTRPTKKTESE